MCWVPKVPISSQHLDEMGTFGTHSPPLVFVRKKHDIRNILALIKLRISNQCGFFSQENSKTLTSADFFHKKIAKHKTCGFFSSENSKTQNLRIFFTIK